MRIINVIVTSYNTGIVLSVDSFGVYEEQLSDEISSKAEKLYVDKCVEYGIDEVDAEESLDDGYIESVGAVIHCCWSDI